MKCPSCGTENSDDARFCKSCAAPQTPAASGAVPPVPPPTAPEPPPPPQPPRHKQPHEDLVGLLSFAFFLLAVAVAFGLNANLIQDFGRWFQLMSSNHTVFVRPPEALIVASAWFFGVIGALEFVGASLRWSLRWTPMRALSRVLSGVGDLVFAVLLLGYADRAISGAFLLTVLVGVVAALLMIYVTLGIYWSSGRPTPGPSPAQPNLRP